MTYICIDGFEISILQERLFVPPAPKLLAWVCGCLGWSARHDTLGAGGGL